MQQSLKTLILTLATLGLASCGGGGGGGAGGDFGEPEAAKARTHVCPTSVLALSTPFFKPGGEAIFASGAQTLFSHEGGLEGMGAFADAGDVIGVALTLHPGSDMISASRESNDGVNEDINFKRFLVARFRDNDFNTNTLDIGNLAYVYLATPQTGSNTSTPVLLPENQPTGGPEIADNKTLVAYKEGADFRYTTTESSSAGPFISGKDYLKQRLEEEAVASGASPIQMHDRIFSTAGSSLIQNAADGADYLGYTSGTMSALSTESNTRKTTANTCQANAVDTFTARIGSSRSTVKDELAAMETEMASGRLFNPLAQERIRQKAYEHLCPESNRFSKYLDDRINSAAWDTASSDSSDRSERNCLRGPFAVLGYGHDIGGSISNKIYDKIHEQSKRSQWRPAIRGLELIWAKIFFDIGCDHYDSNHNNDQSHFEDWFDAITSNNIPRMKELYNDDILEYPEIRELRWVEEIDDGYLKGCFNGSEDWPATENRSATTETLHQAILAEARAQGATCADSRATVSTFKADMTAYVDAMDENPSQAATGPRVTTLIDQKISGTDQLGEASFVFPFSKALACLTKNAISMSEPGACPISREEAMADLQALVGNTRLRSPESGAMVLTPLHSDSRVAEVLESTYRTTNDFIKSVNQGIYNLSSGATGLAIGDACMQHVMPLIDWTKQSEGITKLNLQNSGISKGVFIDLVRDIHAAKSDAPYFSLKQIDATNLGISIDSKSGSIEFADGSGLDSDDEEIFEELFGYAQDEKVVLLVDGGQVAREQEDIDMVLPEPE